MKACIFDLDGTLTDTLDSLIYSVNLTLQEMGLTEIGRRSVPKICREWSTEADRRCVECSRR